MRVLFVTTTVPFPPRQGVELTNASLIEGFATHHEVDLAVITPPGDGGYAMRRPNVPGTVRRVQRLTVEGATSWRHILREAAGIRPAFFRRHFHREEVRAVLAGGPYDLLWASPVGCLGLVDYCRAEGMPLPPYVGLGLNDVKSTLYDNAFRELISGRIGWSWRHLLRGLRVPGLRRHERRYLSEVDIVHVQTKQEQRRAEQILGTAGRTPRLVIGPNGRKVELEQVQYRGRDSARVLYMTHLDGPRRRESRWFLDNVWPAVRARTPHARLVMVGTPPPADSLLRHDAASRGIDIVGYAPDLVSLYDSVAVAVVPILHGTGIVNRVLDALTAGVPLVTTPEAASTITGLTAGVHAAVCRSAEQFGAETVDLLTDAARREKMSAASRVFARTHPTWSETVATVVGGVAALSGARQHI